VVRARPEHVRVLAAPDKFRGTATALEVCKAIDAAVRLTRGETLMRPMADGGEGTVEACGGSNRVTRVTGPTGSLVDAAWRLDEQGLAVIESAAACGLDLAGGAEGNQPLTSSSRGVGELIVAAAKAGASRILLGVGGSATTDGGWPAVERLLEEGVAHRGTRDLDVPISVCCDVQTRFTDAARVFGPQKGAEPWQIPVLSLRLEELQQRYLTQFGVDLAELDGAGAAGGLAGGLAAVGAELVPGFSTLADVVGLRALLTQCDLVITGEGRFDATSHAGKVVGEIMNLAVSAQVPLLVVAGSVDAEERRRPLPPEVSLVSLTEFAGEDRALNDTAACVTDAVQRYLRARE
jgi:glycerate kinase